MHGIKQVIIIQKKTVFPGGIIHSYVCCMGTSMGTTVVQPVDIVMLRSKVRGKVVTAVINDNDFNGWPLLGMNRIQCLLQKCLSVSGTNQDRDERN